jgi:hypothetical protein
MLAAKKETLFNKCSGFRTFVLKFPCYIWALELVKFKVLIYELPY